MKKNYDFHTHEISTESNSTSIYNHAGFDFFIPKNQYYNLGIHPWYIKHPKDQLNELQDLLSQKQDDAYLVGLGEVGLDKKSSINFDLQMKVLKKQLELAKRYHLPFITLHIVKAYQEVYNALLSSGFQPTLLLHDYHGNYQTYKQFQNKFKTYVSFNTHSFTRKNTKEILQNLEADFILPETDELNKQSLDILLNLLTKNLNISQIDYNNLLVKNFNDFTSRPKISPIE